MRSNACTTLLPVACTASRAIHGEVSNKQGRPQWAATAILSVDGAVVTPLITQIGNDVRFRYESPTGLRFGQRVDVSLTVSDTSVPPHTTTYAYFYKTSVGNGTAGDINRSGRIDGGDMAQLAIRFGSRSFDARYDFDADIDANGVIDGLDLAIVATAFGYRP